jgi:hypothetical protein
MKYVFLIYQDEKQGDAMSTSERDALEKAYLTSEKNLRQSGYLFAVEDLQSNQAAITVRLVNSKVSIADGSFAETEGQSIQLFFVNARDLNEAIRVASKMPQVHRSPIEVRPIMDLNRQ